jgi:Icc-related predicted phosphoesterase
MKISFFSDTHKKHEKVNFTSGDILICCGDFTSRGSINDVKKFSSFIKNLNYTYKVVIAGNHDFCFENQDREVAEEILKNDGLIYLNDSGCKLHGLNIWGSPIQPWFHDWAFNRQPGDDIKKHWDLIPNDTDILITHGPPKDILDLCYHGARVGCPDLLKKVLEVRPKVHAFGHIHESYGVLEHEGITFVNACNLNEKYIVVNDLITLEVLK